MARVTYPEALEQGSVEIADKFLMVQSENDSYTRTYSGNHPYRVVQDTNGDYQVYPTYWTVDSKLTNERYPIIRTKGDNIMVSVRTKTDPYNYTYGFPSEIKEGENKELKVLEAFNAFVSEEFTFGVYHIFIEDDVFVEDEEVPYEQTDKFERELIHPRAGKYIPSEPNSSVMENEVVTDHSGSNEQADVDTDNVDSTDGVDILEGESRGTTD